MFSIPLLKSTVDKEGMYRVSKFLSYSFLVDEQEMQSLFNRLPKIMIFAAGGIVKECHALIQHEEFLASYGEYLRHLKRGEQIEARRYRRAFCNYLAYDIHDVFAVTQPEERVIIKPRRPVIQMLLHHFYPSKVDGKLHDMVMTTDSIHWGLQLSLPQIFEDPINHSHHKVNKEHFPIAQAFKEVIFWLRQTAAPATLFFQGQKIRATFRISQSALAWVNNHPSLKSHGIQVIDRSKERENER